MSNAPKKDNAPQQTETKKYKFIVFEGGFGRIIGMYSGTKLTLDLFEEKGTFDNGIFHYKYLPTFDKKEDVINKIKEKYTENKDFICIRFKSADREKYYSMIETPKNTLAALNASTDEIAFLAAAGIDHFQEAPDDEPAGLGKPVPAADIYKMITNSIIEMLKDAKKTDYKKSWKDETFFIPINYDSKKPYRGINLMMLHKHIGLVGRYLNPYFLTFNQIKKHGGKLRKGAKGYEVIYYTIRYVVPADKHSGRRAYSSTIVQKVKDFLNKHKLNEKIVKRIPMIRYYHVYNGTDIEGIPFKLQEVQIGRAVPDDAPENQAAQLIVDNYPNPPAIAHGGNRAYYQPNTDKVQMPKFSNFNSANDYYRTLFHELTHSTGHESRLNRDFSGSFGDEAYAKEELVAEFGAVFLSAWAGIMWYNNQNHAAYLKGWNSAIKAANNDNKFLMRAASLAQAATDHILALDEDGQPAFIQQLTPTKAAPKSPKKEPEPKPQNSKPKTQNSKLKITNFESVKTIPLKDLYTDEKRFQNRKKLNEEIVNNIVKNFKPTDLDPLVVWYDKKQDKTFVLAGHHRYEALRRLGHKTVPVKFANTDYPTEADAIRYAKEISNANRTLEEPYERASIYRQYRDNGYSEKEINEKAAIEGKNRSYILNLSCLNPKGSTMSTLVQFSQTQSKSDKNEIERIAPLNLTRVKYQSEGERQYDEEVNNLKNQISTYQGYIDDLKNRFINPLNPQYINPNSPDYMQVKQIADSKIAEYNTKIQYYQKELLKVYQNKQTYIKPTGQIALFGSLPTFKTLKELRDYAYNWAKDNLSGKSYEHPEIGKLVHFTNAGTYHCLRRNLNKIKILLIFQAMEMLKNSHLISFSPDYKGRKEIAGAYKMKTFITLEGEEYDVTLTLRQGENGIVYYDHDGTKISKTSHTTESEKSQSALVKRSLATDKHTAKTVPNTLAAPTMFVETIPQPTPTAHTLAAKMQALQHRTWDSFIIANPQMQAFLGEVERKPRESTVITIAGGAGSGKTRFAFQFINALAQNYKVGHASLEEHPDSKLYYDKVTQYLDETAQANVEAPEIKNLTQLQALIQRNDVIVIDSFAKLQEMNNRFLLDRDLRKAYDGKLFLLIYQLTGDNKMRGGSKSEFDGDIILLTHVAPDYRENYIYPSKNRYNAQPATALRYSTYYQQMLPPESEVEANANSPEQLKIQNSQLITPSEYDIIY